MALWARSKFGTPMFEPEIIWNQMHCIEESTCDTVGTLRHRRSISELSAVIRRLHSDSAPRNCAPLAPPVVTPLCAVNKLRDSFSPMLKCS